MNFSRCIVRLRSKIERAVGISFPGSSRYWDRRYVAGGNSGAGSYGRLAQFKAEYLNSFVAKNAVRSVIEFGCGDGHQLSLAKYPTYYGVDVSKRALTICQKKFNDDSTKRFGPEAPIHSENFDLALSLDVIYHLVEDETYENYMESLFAASRSWVIIYSSNVSPAEFTKLYPNHSAPHVKHRKFTEWADTRLSGWRLVRHDRNPFPFDVRDPNDTSFADFFVYERTGGVR